MSTVFISYRRENAAGEARALFNDLAARLREDSVFMDVDSIALGRDFRSVLQETAASCDLMLVLIGRNWADARDEGGRVRLENPADYVRLARSRARARHSRHPCSGARSAHAGARGLARRDQEPGVP